MSKTNSKPIIGVTGPDKGGTVAWWFTKLSLALQGAKAVRIRPSRPVPGVPLDGLVIGGGADINPLRYGQKLGGGEGFETGETVKPFLRRFFIRLFSFLFYPFLWLMRKLFSAKRSDIDEKRDELEFELLHKAVRDELPVLGICRGAQLINVLYDGTLHQEIAGFYGEVPRIHSVWPRKKVKLNERSALSDIVDTDALKVNALHHQAVDQVGEPLLVAAREENGIIQAIEHPYHPFLIGVQWHPEYMPQIPVQRKIFSRFVEACTRRSDRSKRSNR